MEKPYKNMDYNTLLDSPQVARLGEHIILNDNFDCPLQLDEEMVNHIRSKPNKLISLTNVLVCLDGHIDITQNLKDIRLGKNDVNIAQSGSFGTFRDISADAKFFLLIINDDFILPFLEAAATPELKRHLFNHTNFHLPEKDMAHALTLYNTLKSVLQSDDKMMFKKEMAEGLVKALLFGFYEQLVKEAKHDNIGREKQSRAQEIFNRFMEEVQINYTKERDIKFYADKICVSPKYLTHVVSSVSGTFANDHIRNYVIGEAKALILSRRFSISQIADILHFNSLSFFTKYFKNATGLSPVQFQNKAASNRE